MKIIINSIFVSLLVSSGATTVRTKTTDVETTEAGTTTVSMNATGNYIYVYS